MLSEEKTTAIRALARDGFIEPAHVVEAARDPESPLHDEFIWNVNEAAQQHWLDTARSLIRVVRVEVKDEPARSLAPYYVVDPLRPPKSQRYIQLDKAARDRELSGRVLSDEIDRIVAAIRRAQAVAGALGLSEELASLLDNVDMLRTRAETAAAERAAAEKPRRRKLSRAEARA